VRIELDNAAARRTLLALIGSAERRLHVQSYIVEDDALTASVEAALRAAAARGVEVRALADSLYSLHGSFGAENAMLSRLAACPGIEVRVARPIEGLPTIEDLKQRDHRKLVIADGAAAMVGGRNLGRVYYTSFAEAQITPRSRWSDVPWLDAGALVEGPAAAALDEAFLGAWLDAGGAPFAPLSCPPMGAPPGQAGLRPQTPPPAGDVAVRVVVHHGLRDARTLEAYLALIDGAREELFVVHGFPLQLEVQHALLRALGRGARVRLLMGRVRPVFGDREAFAGGAIRELADELVRARLDPLVERGAEVHELALRPLPGWDPALRLVRPSVHAKLVIADREASALGSANLDITAGYWESEVLLVVEDAAVSRALAEEVDRLLATSIALRGDAPSFREGASFRAWLGRYWPSLVG
jgi:phosphatidylserine/phosphatidylglycerophosphate/cardiolipin synthase-like enzyme